MRCDWLRSSSSSLLTVLVAGSLALGVACKGSVEDLPDEPPPDEDWINALDEDGGAEAAEPVAAAEPADTGAAVAAGETGEPEAAGETGGETGALAAAEAGGETGGAAEPGAAPAEPAAVSSAKGTPKAAAGGSEAAPAESPSEDAPAEPEAPAAAEAPAEPAPAEVAPAPAPEPEKPAPPPPITMADYAGTYTYTGGSAQKKKLAEAIEGAANQVAAIIRGVARKRLTKTQILETPITISIAGDKVTFKLGTTGGSWSATIDGPTTTMKYNGDKYKVKVRQKDGKLITTFMAPDATKTIVYVLNEDRKRMTVHHRLVADQLKTPMTFRLSYKKN
ncbi:hypothetical protein PPSIR1_36712 [Plesiocystis pacifica SIR-1]|uniref:Uncharacterized protein n=1 Tax=Plesiocystis pacifica SIR-1 TaxID=391625 RepID=A6G1P7_9BACT|nr:hypothetical protein [Plesiocystis pacifica]EDM80311.1 hypothetical protein PPSIR1_36712 [Plesiocystis pacifica SIR-1]